MILSVVEGVLSLVPVNLELCVDISLDTLVVVVVVVVVGTVVVVVIVGGGAVTLAKKKRNF